MRRFDPRWRTTLRLVQTRFDRTEISLLERGARDPRLSTISRLAHALGTDSAALLDGIGSSERRAR